MPSRLRAWLRPWAVLLLATGAPPPAIPQEADPERGRAIYTEACAECHMEDATGDSVAPDIAGIPRNNLRRAIGGLEGMPEFELPPEDLAAVLAYLRTLDR